MKDKILNAIGVAVCCLGGLLVLGAVGAADCDTYTIGQALAQVAVGVGVILGGAAIIPAYSEKEDEA